MSYASISLARESQLPRLLEHQFGRAPVHCLVFDKCMPPPASLAKLEPRFSVKVNEEVSFAAYIVGECVVAVSGWEGAVDVITYGLSPETCSTTMRLLFSGEDPSLFSLSVNDCNDLELRRLNLGGSTILSEQELRARYGEDYLPWEKELLKSLTQGKGKLTLLSGEIGKGKTTCLSHLAGKLQGKVTMFTFLGDPMRLLDHQSFFPFLLQHKEKKPVILLDNLEMVIPGHRDYIHRVNRHLAEALDGLSGKILGTRFLCVVDTVLDLDHPGLKWTGRSLEHLRVF